MKRKMIDAIMINTLCDLYGHKIRYSPRIGWEYLTRAGGARKRLRASEFDAICSDVAWIVAGILRERFALKGKELTKALVYCLNWFVTDRLPKAAKKLLERRDHDGP